MVELTTSAERILNKFIRVASKFLSLDDGSQIQQM